MLTTILLVLVFGIIDFGTAYNRKITASQAAREGARLAALGNSTTAVETRTKSAGSGLSLTSTDVRVCFRATTDSSSCSADSASPVCASGVTTGDAVVTVVKVYQFMTPVAALAELTRQSLTITSTGRMPCGG